MANVRLPYVRLREQPDGTIRPRSSHGPRQRALGFKDQDLKHPNGAWLTFQECREFSDTRVREVAAAIESGQSVALPVRKGSTIEHLLEDWIASPEVQGLSAKSVSSYRKAMRAVIFRPESRTEAADRRKKEKAAAVLGVAPPEREREPMAAATPSSVGAPELRNFYNYLKDARGHHMALAAIAALSAAFTWGRESTSWRLGRNPRLDMEFDQPDGRVVLVTLEEFHALVAAADASGRPSIGDAIYLGLFTGQRQTDRLALVDVGLTGEGRRKFKQSKTGAIVEIKETPQLAARLTDAGRRAKELKLRLQLRELPQTIVVDETTGRPYNEHTYRHSFADIRTLAAFGALHRSSIEDAKVRAAQCAADMRKWWPEVERKFPLTGNPEQVNSAIDARGEALSQWLMARAKLDSNGAPDAWRLTPCPGLLFVNVRGEIDAKHDQDLRDTCVMLLDRAGNDILSICDVTGHSYQSAQTIMKHYRARNAARADVAIDKLVAFIGKEGMTG